MNDNMRTSHAGIEFIAKWEACILKPYKDVAGLWTVGIGHLIVPGEDFPHDKEITRERAFEILAEDLSKCEAAIKKSIKVPLTQNQFDALVSFGFNCGVGVYSSSEACKTLNAGKYDAVPNLLLNWSKATVGGQKVVVQGLYNRRKSEGEMFARAVEDVDPEASTSRDVLTHEEKVQLSNAVAQSLQTIADKFLEDTDALKVDC